MIIVFGGTAAAATATMREGKRMLQHIYNNNRQSRQRAPIDTATTLLLLLWKAFGDINTNILP